MAGKIVVLLMNEERSEQRGAGTLRFAVSIAGIKRKLEQLPLIPV